MNKSKNTSDKPNLKDSIPEGKNIYEVSYSLLGSGSIEVQSTGPEQALQSVQTLPLEILIAKADFKNGLEVHELTEKLKL
jgi:hypothetical protein